MTGNLDQITPARILWLLREGHASNIRELSFKLALRHNIGSVTLHHIWGRVGQVIEHLHKQGFVKFPATVDFELFDHSGDDILEAPILVSELLQEVLAALELSLTQLYAWGPDTLCVRPLLGEPESRDVPDAFVLMPFLESMRPVYEDHIRRVAESQKLSVARADDFFAAGAIVSDIWNAIYNCEVVIAGCTGRNPNVFYEIGIAHTVGKPAVLITQSIDDVPFDLRYLRCIVYEYTPRGMEQFEQALAQALAKSRTAAAKGLANTANRADGKRRRRSLA